MTSHTLGLCQRPGLLKNVNEIKIRPAAWLFFEKKSTMIATESPFSISLK